MLTACGIETIHYLSYLLILRVATVLTACGIETNSIDDYFTEFCLLQQCLPLAVLKPTMSFLMDFKLISVATVLTACGIETFNTETEKSFKVLQQCLPLAVLKLL